MFPSGSRLTTEGQSVEPCGPTIHFGCLVCGSRYATRLLVVPRSIPTIFPISANPLKAFSSFRVPWLAVSERRNYSSITLAIPSARLPRDCEYSCGGSAIRSRWRIAFRGRRSRRVRPRRHPNPLPRTGAVNLLLAIFPENCLPRIEGGLSIRGRQFSGKIARSRFTAPVRGKGLGCRRGRTRRLRRPRKAIRQRERIAEPPQLYSQSRGKRAEGIARVILE